MSARLVLCCLVSLAALLTVGASVPVRASTPTSPLSPQWDPTCYSTYEQIDTILHNTALEYPHIATVIDGGLAWEGTRHIWALKLETSVNPGPKPGIFLVAG